MFRKLKPVQLLVVFAVLLLLFAITQWMQNRKGEKTFRTEIAPLDTAKVTEILLQEGKKEVRIFRTDNLWKVSAGHAEWKADPNAVRNLMEEVSLMKAEQVAATSDALWKELGVDDSAGIHVTIKGKRKILAGIVVGRFSYRPPLSPYDRQGTAVTYVRRTDEKNVYAVNGFLRFSMAPDPGSFRNKNLLSGQSASWMRLRFTYPGDSSFVLEKKDKGWYIDQMPADSAKTEEYLGNMEHVIGYEFADSAQRAQFPAFALLVEQNGGNPIEIKAFLSDSVHHYVLSSSQNPESWFSGKNGLTERIFKGKSYFSGKEKGMKKTD